MQEMENKKLIIMRKQYFILILILGIGLRTIAQGCLPEGIKFTTQEQIDNFQTDYPNCSIIEGYIELNGTNISSLMGLNLITKVMGSFIINGTSIANLGGLENLLKIGDGLIIISNDMLTNISGLNNLDSICGNLTIGWNDLLPTLSGIDSLNSGSFQNLYIRANHSLTECDVQSICVYLTSPNGTVLIFDNASGCNSRDEIQSLCQTDIQDNSKPKFTVYPNPANEFINICIENNEHIERISIYNQFGQVVLQINQDINHINTSNLQPGIYFIELELTEKIYTDLLLVK